jgi:transposase
LGRGGISAVHRATGISIVTIRKGIQELNAPEQHVASQRIRKPGGGKKTITAKQPHLLDALQLHLESSTCGDPMSPLKWTSKSIRKLAAVLNADGYACGMTSVRRLLKQLGYSLQANRKTRDGSSHCDRNAQFEYINEHIKQEISAT